MNEFCTKVEECKAALQEQQRVQDEVAASNDNMPTTLLSPVALAPETHEAEDEDEEEEAGEDDYETYDDDDEEVLPQ